MMRSMPPLMLTLTIVMFAGNAQGVETDLEGGVFIAHHISELQYTEQPEDACGDYLPYELVSAADQINRIDYDGTTSTWFVLAAWFQPKEFCAFQFGFEGYDPAAYDIVFHGSCSPGSVLSIPSNGWPGPNAPILR